MSVIKKKSLLVAFISSFILSAVLVLTLVSYIVYLELKEKDLSASYEHSLEEINAELYASYIDVSGITAKTEGSGALKGNPIIEGSIKNTGNRNVTDLLLKVRFLDNGNVVIYEAIFHPQEPSLGSSSLTQVAIPYLTNYRRIALKPGDAMAFKRIITNCPPEIAYILKKEEIGSSGSRRRISTEVLSLSFTKER